MLDINFNFFDEIPWDIMKERLDTLPRIVSGKLNIYNPESVFQRFFKQAVDTSGSLPNINLEKLRATRLSYDERLPFLNCQQIVQHIWGTSAALMYSPEFDFDLIAIQKFFRTYLMLTLKKYNQEIEINPYLFNEVALTAFRDFILISIIDKNKLNDENLRLEDWIDLYINQDAGLLPIETEMQMLEMFISVTISQQYPDLYGHANNLNLVVQTLVWYLLTNTDPKMLMRFKKRTITLPEVVNCFAAGVYLKSKNRLIEQ